MKKAILTIIYLLIFGISNSQEFNSIDYNTIDTLPDENPRIFKPDLISLPMSNEHTCMISSDGNSIYFTRDPDRKIFIISRTNEGWSKPLPTPFNGREAILTPDGTKVLYGDGDIWISSISGDSTDKPKKLSSSINTDAYEFYASMTNDGQIFFSRFVDNRTKIFVSELVNGEYQTAQELPDPINKSASNNFHPYISSKGDFIIFNSDREGGFGGADLYLSYLNDKGHWDTPKNLGEKINSEFRDICPTVTLDGKYLFFTRNWQENDKWLGDLFWINIDYLKNVE
jgi:Tol biopolymer transport system component